MFELLVVFALGVALCPGTLLKSLLASPIIGYLICLQNILKLVNLFHVVFVDALQLTCLEPLQEAVGLVFSLFEVVVFSRALRAEVEVALFVIILAILRNDAIVVAARLSLRPEVIILDPSDVFDFGVRGGSRIDKLRPCLVDLNVTYKFLYGVPIKLGFIRGSVRDYVHFGRRSHQVRSRCPRGLRSRHLCADHLVLLYKDSTIRLV